MRDAPPGAAGTTHTERGFLSTLAGRLLLASILWLALALGVGGLVLSLSFRDYVTSDVDARLTDLLSSMIGNTEISADGVIRFTRPLYDERFAEPYSGWYWQISAPGQEAFRSRSLWDVALETDFADPRFELRLREAAGPDGQKLRLAERDVILPESDTVYRYKVATDLSGFEDAVGRFNMLLVLSLLVILLTSTVALVLQVAYGLRPLRQLKRALVDVRQGRQRLIGARLPADLSPLADEINGLISQNERLLDRARTHVGNLAHALKTPLAVIMNERGNPRIERQARDMQRHIDHHLKRARIAGGGSGSGIPIGERLASVKSAVASMHAGKTLRFDQQIDPRLQFDGEQEDFDEIAGNLVDNAAKWCREQIALSARLDEKSLRRPMVLLVVEDDGDGVGPADMPHLFERGKRLDERVPGSGLGLAIVRDIAELYGGRVRSEASTLGGLKVSVSLPARLASKT